jgi:hypothetical protein
METISLGINITGQSVIRFLDSSITGGKMEVQWDNTLAIHGFQVLCHSTRVWGYP